MIDRGYRQKAMDYRAKASLAPTLLDRDWAVYCANILEGQADLLDKTGRCPEVPLPPSPNLHG